MTRRGDSQFRRFAGGTVLAVPGRMRLTLLIGAMVVAACGVKQAGNDPLAEDRSAELYDRTTLLQVDIQLAEADWESLRTQAVRVTDIFGSDCLTKPVPKPYTYFRASVTIDGVRVDDVGVRKKGLLGSQSETKPSLKIKLSEFIKGQKHLDQKRITLNNSIQDPGYVNQCLGYDLFNAAGIPAPRCNFARVSVNGRDLGVYVHVEDVKKGFLRRNYDAPDGNLYEGTISDFRDEFKLTFERKTNKLDVDQTDIQQVVTAAGASDASLISSLGAHVDIDQFIDFWAMESLISHWDGYAGNTNNFFVYDDPGSGKIVFMPWGIDGTFHGAELPMTTGVLARRLYDLPETRAKYVAAIRRLLDDVWHETELVADIDAWHALIRPALGSEELTSVDERITELKQIINSHRSEVLNRLADMPGQVEEPLRSADICFEQFATMTIAFSTTWNSLGRDPFEAGTGSFELTLDSNPTPTTGVGAVSGDEGEHATLALMANLEDGRQALVFLPLDQAAIAPGTLDLATMRREAVLLIGRNLFETEPEQFAIIDAGNLRFDRASTSPGATISGQLTATAVNGSF